jgi:hypothetical protein
VHVEVPLVRTQRIQVFGDGIHAEIAHSVFLIAAGRFYDERMLLLAFKERRDADPPVFRDQFPFGPSLPAPWFGSESMGV